MIKPWTFEFLGAPQGALREFDPPACTKLFDWYLDLWVRLEELGFEGIFFSEHHFSNLGYSPSPNLLIAAVAGRTRRLRLGVMGLVLPLYEPWRVAEEVGMLDHLTHGRLEFGTSNGTGPMEPRRVGMNLDELRPRYEEALDVIDAALVQPVFSHHGRFWNFDDLTVIPRPLQQPTPPRWMTVVSRESARRAARRGYKICTGFHATEQIRQIFDAYREEAERTGNPAGPDQLAIRRHVVVAEKEADARALSDQAFQTLAAGFSAAAAATLAQALVRDAPPSDSVHSVFGEGEFVAGTSGAVADQIVEQCRHAGAGHILATAMPSIGLEHMRESYELFGRDVVPLLRGTSVGI